MQLFELVALIADEASVAYPNARSLQQAVMRRLPRAAKRDLVRALFALLYFHEREKEREVDALLAEIDALQEALAIREAAE
jgi:hypothetical protein